MTQGVVALISSAAVVGGIVLIAAFFIIRKNVIDSRLKEFFKNSPPEKETIDGKEYYIGYEVSKRRTDTSPGSDRVVTNKKIWYDVDFDAIIIYKYKILNDDPDEEEQLSSFTVGSYVAYYVKNYTYKDFLELKTELDCRYLTSSLDVSQELEKLLKRRDPYLWLPKYFDTITERLQITNPRINEFLKNNEPAQEYKDNNMYYVGFMLFFENGPKLYRINFRVIDNKIVLKTPNLTYYADDYTFRDFLRLRNDDSDALINIKAYLTHSQDIGLQLKKLLINIRDSNEVYTEEDYTEENKILRDNFAKTHETFWGGRTKRRRARKNKNRHLKMSRHIKIK